ncbi:keywimysin-related RiPP [Micromonospora echinospora]
MKEEYVAPTLTPMGGFQEETGFFVALNVEIAFIIGDWTP